MYCLGKGLVLYVVVRIAANEVWRIIVDYYRDSRNILPCEGNFFVDCKITTEQRRKIKKELYLAFVRNG